MVLSAMPVFYSQFIMSLRPAGSNLLISRRLFKTGRFAMARGPMRHTHGSIEVVCGSMFSGKTDELIRRLVRATIAKQKVQVFKPAIDVRYAVEKVTSHAGSNFDATPVGKSSDILAKLEKDTT